MDQQLTGNYAIFYNTYLVYLTDYIQNDPDYAYTKENCKNVAALAHKMVIGFVSGAANKDGGACKATCKHLGINHTYKAIREFITKPLSEV